MGEVEFDGVIDVVRTAISSLTGPLQAANDNQDAWPLIPFRDGWHRSANNAESPLA
jgi:hypothetical protein